MSAVSPYVLPEVREQQEETSGALGLVLGHVHVPCGAHDGTLNVWYVGEVIGRRKGQRHAPHAVILRASILGEARRLPAVDTCSFVFFCSGYSQLKSKSIALVLDGHVVQDSDCLGRRDQARHGHVPRRILGDAQPRPPPSVKALGVPAHSML